MPVVPAADGPVPNYRLFAVGTGLPDPAIRDIETDREGFLWVATRSGIYRYDGLYLDPMSPEVGGRRIASVARIEFDEDGGLWAMSESQFHHRNPATGKWDRILDQPPQERGQGIFEFTMAPDGAIWLATAGLGIVRVDPESNAFEYPDAPDGSGAPARLFYDVMFDRQGRLWAGSSVGLHRYNPRSDSFDYFLPPLPGQDPDDFSRADFSSIFALAETSAGRLVLATNTGPIAFDPVSERFEHLPGWADRYWGSIEERFQRIAGSIAEDDSGRIWTGIDGAGLDVFDPESLRWINIPPRPEDVFGLMSPLVRKIHVSPDGLIWFGTDRGLNRVDPRSGRFKRWAITLATGPASGLQQIHQLVEDSRGVLWAATNSGLQRLDPGTGAWTVHPLVADPEAPPNLNWTHSVLEDRSRQLWVTTSGRINRFDRETASYDTSLVGRAFMFLHDDGSDKLLAGLGFSGGLARFDPVNGILSDLDGNAIHRQDPETETFQAYSVLVDSRSNQWVATSEGLKLWKPESGALLDVELGLDGLQGIARVLEAPDRRLWLGSAQGLLLFDPDSGRLTSGEESPLPADPVYEMTLDGRGRLWLATPDGLRLFDPESGESRLYQPDDGLPGADIDTGRLITHSNGHIVAATANEVFTFDPGEFPDTRPPPPVSVSAIEVDDTPANEALYGESPGLLLDHTNLLVRFNFAALDFAHPERNRYRYRLAGLGEPWRAAGAEDASASYTTLPPGEYRFEVQAANSDGVWNEAGAALDVEVLPPPWRTGWAYASYFVALILSVALIVAARTRQVRHRARELESEVQARTREIDAQRRTISDQASRLEHLLDTKNRLFADISHEFRTPLTLIAGPIEDARARAEDEDISAGLGMARHSVDRLSRLVDQLLDLARLDAGQAISRAPQPLSAIVTSQVKAFQGLARARGIEFNEGEIQSLWVAVGSDALEKILANLLSNAIKFTPEGGRVTVSLRREDGEACLEVSDTGIGIPEEFHQAVFERFNRGLVQGEQVSGAGIGLALVRELAVACGGRVELRSMPGEGTTVRVYLPQAAEPDSLLEPSLQPGAAVRQELGVLGEGSAAATRRTGRPEAEQVLIIEDNTDLRRYLPSVLGSGFEYLTAADGESGLELARDEIPDLVICDAMLPGMDGFEVCRQIKSDAATSHVPVMILTARADDASRLTGYESHADDYLTKPFSGDELRLRVRNLLEARRIMRRRFGRQLFANGAPLTELTDPDQAFLEKLERCLTGHHADPDFSASSLAKAMAMSLRQLQRKLKAVVDHTPAEYIRNYRLTAAKARLEAGESVGQACFAVGFTSQSYFSRCFKALFGLSPSEVSNGGDTKD